MNYRILTILAGIVVAIAGFVFAFSAYSYLAVILGIVIGVGGIVIAIVGFSYFRKSQILKVRYR